MLGKKNSVKQLKAHQSRCAWFKKKLLQYKTRTRDATTETRIMTNSIEVQTESLCGDRYSCSICYINYISVVVYPCMHYICKDCEKEQIKSKKCFRCRQHVVCCKDMYL